MYAYEWQGFGIVLKGFSGGRTVWLQGDEAADLHDQLQRVSGRVGPCGALLADSIIAEYECVAE
jgi:hypothetical protein